MVFQVLFAVQGIHLHHEKKSDHRNVYNGFVIYFITTQNLSSIELRDLITTVIMTFSFARYRPIPFLLMN
jgi:hypothetical protein